jgi:hypothetical protein
MVVITGFIAIYTKDNDRRLACLHHLRDHALEGFPPAPY